MPTNAFLQGQPGHREGVSIGVVGAGLSGTLAALQLAARLPPEHGVLLFERGAQFASGLAYSTEDADHLLNVPAARMSAFADRPDHFTAWLDRTGVAPADRHATPSGVYVRRGVYGAYLRALLAAVPDTRIRRIPAAVSDIREFGEGLVVICADGASHAVAGVVLALGNLPSAETDDDLHVANPWTEQALHGLFDGETRPVLILGTGLTMIDLAQTIAARGGPPVIAMSRRGLPPQRHAPSETWPTPSFSDADRRSPTRLLRRQRGEIAAAAAVGVDWRGVVDACRPITVALWQGLDVAGRRRFLRHLRPWWDTRRSRMAEPAADRIAAMQADGRLQICAGRIERTERGGDHLRVTWRPRGSNATRALDVRRMIDASGVERLSRGGEGLADRLLTGGLARFDAVGLSFDVTPELRLIDAAGRADRPIWALGPMVRGVFWECVATPEIRVQAAQLADTIAGRLAG